MNIMEDLFDMQRIYHRAIFDCFSEGLTAAIQSSPLSIEECLSNRHKRKQEEAENWLEKAMEFVLDCATILAGIIRDKEDSMMGNIRYMEPEFVQQLREERMYRMITLAVVDGQPEHGARKRVGPQARLRDHHQERLGRECA